jgi:CRP/FNR family transcriptional regulator
MSHQQIANELGTTREVVSRLLKKLEKQQRISLGQKSIELL